MKPTTRAKKKGGAIGLKKEVFGIDEPSVCATVAYGFSDRSEAIKVIAQYSGEDTETVKQFVRRVRIIRFKKDGEWFYFWGNECPHCGSKNKGEWSYIWEA